MAVCTGHNLFPSTASRFMHSPISPHKLLNYADNTPHITDHLFAHALQLDLSVSSERPAVDVNCNLPFFIKNVINFKLFIALKQRRSLNFPAWKDLPPLTMLIVTPKPGFRPHLRSLAVGFQFPTSASWQEGFGD